MILVTGASGYVGGQVVRQLSSLRPIACVRSPAKAPKGSTFRLADYDDVNSLVKAFALVKTVVFVPSDGFADDVSRHCRNVFDATRFAGVGRVIFLSIVDTRQDSPFYYAPVYREAEEYLSSTMVPAAILRSGLYSDFVESAFVEPVRKSGVLELPAENAKVRLISRNEVATRIADTVLGSNFGVVNLVQDVNPIGFEDIARVNDLTYKNIDPGVYYDRVKNQMEAPWPEAFSSLFASIRQGRFS